MPFSQRILALFLVAVIALIPGSAVVQAEEVVPPAPNPSATVLYLPAIAQVNEHGASTVDTTVYFVEHAEQQRALDYWSYAHRTAAKAVSFPVMDQTQLTDGAPEPEARYASGQVRGAMPARDADRLAQLENAEEWLRIEGEQAAELQSELEEYGPDIDISSRSTDGTGSVYTSYRTNYYSESWKQDQYRAVGKLYFKNAAGGNSSCSASVISPHNIVVTAAHCVYDRSARKWASSWVFVPADRNGSAPYGAWTASNARVLTNYITSGGIRNDVALVKLNYKSGRPVSYYTGYLGRAWNYSYTQHLHAQGYPSNLDNGQYLWTCVAESFNRYGTDVLGMGCNMMWGSSGGPWIWRFHPYRVGSFNYVMSVVSGDPELSRNNFYGPRFSSNNIVPLCNAEGC